MKTKRRINMICFGILLILIFGYFVKKGVHKQEAIGALGLDKIDTAQIESMTVDQVPGDAEFDGTYPDPSYAKKALRYLKERTYQEKAEQGAQENGITISFTFTMKDGKEHIFYLTNNMVGNEEGIWYHIKPIQ